MYRPTMFVLLLLLAIVMVRGQVPDSTDYLTESGDQCHRDGSLYACGKYRLLKYLDRVSSDTVLETNSSVLPVQLVRIHQPDAEGTLFPEARSLTPVDDVGKLLRFMQERADRFLRTQGIAVPLPRGFRLIQDEELEEDEDEKEEKTNEHRTNDNMGRGRVHHKKKGLISLLTLFGVFKVKVLLGLVLLGIFFIKKVILLGALILPSLLHNIKASCKHIVPHHVGHSAHGEEYHDDYYGNYGHSGFAKDWERKYWAPVPLGHVAKTI